MYARGGEIRITRSGDWFSFQVMLPPSPQRLAHRGKTILKGSNELWSNLALV